MAKAIALLSGGLDSTLAVLVMLRQGIDVTAVTYLTHFGCDISDKSSCSKSPFPAAKKFGFQVKLCHLGDKFIDIVKNPKYGHGKNMNPCIDCRILMLKDAKSLMELTGADFLITGEVLGQRPMSQRRESFPLIDREAGVEGYVLRPLSAKLLKPTIPEENNLIDREKVYNFHGRNRKPQMALAKELGLTEYPAPAGGCLLTDPIYSYRLKDLLIHNPDPELREINLLTIGRHFRLSDKCRVIIGRNREENEKIESYLIPDDITMRVEGVGSPITLFMGEVEDTKLYLAAKMTARYSDAKHNMEVEVSLFKNLYNLLYKLKVSPAPDELLDDLRIEEGFQPRRTRSSRRKFPQGKSVA